MTLDPEGVQSPGRQARLASIERSVAELRAVKRRNFIVSIVLGVLFLLMETSTAVILVANGAPFSPGFVIAGAAWTTLAVVLLRIGVKGLARLNRDAAIRTSGLRGTATIIRAEPTPSLVDGASAYKLELRITVPNRAPYEHQETVPVERRGAAVENASLPVFVDPDDPHAVVLDWWSSGGR